MSTNSFWDALKSEERARLGDRTQKATTTIGGDTVEVDESETESELSDDHFLVDNSHGVPRGPEAVKAARLGETWAMELVKNAVISQLTGGELSFPIEEDTSTGPVAQFRDLVMDVFDGPHVGRDDLDDLIAKLVSDMIDQGNGYWEILSANGGQIPVAQFKALDALSVKHNVKRNGHFDEPAFYQTPVRQHTGLLSSTSGDPTPMDADQIVLFKWPNSARTGQVYPRSVTEQVETQLDFLSNSTVHANRFFNDNEIPAGILHLQGGSGEDIKKVKSKIEQARGDPRKAAVVGGDGEPKWIEVGGSALNLDILESQEWFLTLVLSAFGIPKQEMGFIEDVNKSTALEQSKMVYKRITLPLVKTIEEAINNQILPQFDLYNELGQPFEAAYNRSDPAQALAEEEHLRERYDSGAISYNEYKQQIGEDPGDTVISIDGMDVDYGEHPMPVVREIIKTRRNQSVASGGEN